MVFLTTMRALPGILALLMVADAGAQDRFFAGGAAGVATISADARFEVPERAAASGYKPQNGPAFCPFFGLHVNDYLSFQTSYIWNSNDVRYHALRGEAFYDQAAETTHQLGVVDAMLYFRRRESWVRPYLTLGTGVAHLSSDAEPATGALGSPPGSFSVYSPVVNFSVGMDLEIRDGWKFRYMFAETIQLNTLSKRLTPPGERNLAGFRNFFGFVKYF
jgi:hypothetical protein